ncbi:cupin domain-containing protein [Puniceibacterium sp. IMCC21224]|uniref:cupin domain-containing protein n=1 Tax=Puniceibacterium sp. IMCC21224 TaxID=1618204 RepID=UPI00064D8CA5|nr:cupin domain-containing protein [Puniceibacterium sp. IMCC21224]
MDIGRRLKTLRNANGFSQRELAKRAGVTNGLISMIEQNRSSPSIASLKRILDAVPMTFSEFFSNDLPDEPGDTMIFRAHELREINPAEALNLPRDAARLLSLRQVGDAARHTIQMLRETYSPGADTGPELYSHAAEEAGIIIEGEIELTVGDRTSTLGAGDAYIFDSRTPHRFRNSGEARCVLISACTPATF